MGFGILLIGYLFATTACGFQGWSDFPSYLIMFCALLKLSDYNKGFLWAKFLSFGMAACGMAGLMLSAVRLLGFSEEINGKLEQYLQYYESGTTLIRIAFHAALLIGLILICRETELPRIERLGMICFGCNSLYAILYAAGLFVNVLVPWTQLFLLAYMFLCAYVIFCCYRMICLEDDADMPVYQSRFEIVNRVRKRLDEKAEIGNRKGEEAEERKRRRAESRQNGVDPSKKLDIPKKRR